MQQMTLAYQFAYPQCPCSSSSKNSRSSFEWFSVDEVGRKRSRFHDQQMGWLSCKLMVMLDRDPKYGRISVLGCLPSLVIETTIPM